MDLPSTFESYATAAQWLDASPVRPELFAAGAPKLQIAEFLILGQRLDIPVRFPSTHVSKSAPLPVAAFLVDGAIAFVRDNFHDIAFAVMGSRPFTIPLKLVHEQKSEQWYEEEKRRAENYSAGKYDFSSLDWYAGWAGVPLLRIDGQLYRARSTYLEGIYGGVRNEVTPRGEEARRTCAEECQRKYGTTPSFDDVGRYPLVGLDEQPHYEPGKLVWATAALGYEGVGELLRALRSPLEPA